MSRDDSRHANNVRDAEHCRVTAEAEHNPVAGLEVIDGDALPGPVHRDYEILRIGGMARGSGASSRIRSAVSPSSAW